MILIDGPRTNICRLLYARNNLIYNCVQVKGMEAQSHPEYDLEFNTYLFLNTFIWCCLSNVQSFTTHNIIIIILLYPYALEL